MKDSLYVSQLLLLRLLLVLLLLLLLHPPDNNIQRQQLTHGHSIVAASYKIEGEMSCGYGTLWTPTWPIMTMLMTIMETTKIARSNSFFSLTHLQHSYMDKTADNCVENMIHAAPHPWLSISKTGSCTELATATTKERWEKSVRQYC